MSNSTVDLRQAAANLLPKELRYYLGTILQFGAGLITIATFITLTVLIFILVIHAYKNDHTMAEQAVHNYHAYMMESLKHPPVVLRMSDGERKQEEKPNPSPPKKGKKPSEKGNDDEQDADLDDSEAETDTDTVKQVLALASGADEGKVQRIGYQVPDRVVNTKVILALIAALIAQLGAATILMMKYLYRPEEP